MKNITLPELRSREEMLEILQREEYGFLPPAPSQIKWKVEKNTIYAFCAGKATLDKVTATCTMENGTFSFPFYVTMPTENKKHPFFVSINFRDAVPDRYMPTEELVDNGFAILSLCYEDITKDNCDFTDGLAGVIYGGKERTGSDPGKIAMWAWACQRVMDYAQTLEELDFNYSVVCGHSRLGKTALLAGATDERFKFAYSNDSGCSGASITRGKKGERVKDIIGTFPFWFCKEYEKYIDNEDKMDFDQHYLLASIAPRRVLVGSASMDEWADPVAEQYSCMMASTAFEKGLESGRFPLQVGEELLGGDIGYHLRGGMHYFSREDWQKLIKFVKSH